MKLFVKLLIFVLILGLAGPFILKRPDGRPWMQISDVVSDVSQWGTKISRWWSSLGRDNHGSDSVEDGDSGGSLFSDNKIYRWRDDNGNLAYSDEPRVDGEYEVVVVGSNRTVVPSVNTPQKEQPGFDSAPQDGGFNVPLPLTVSPEEATQLLKNAEAAKQLIGNREEMLDSKLNESL